MPQHSNYLIKDKQWYEIKNKKTAEFFGTWIKIHDKEVCIYIFNHAKNTLSYKKKIFTNVGMTNRKLQERFNEHREDIVYLNLNAILTSFLAKQKSLHKKIIITCAFCSCL